jgi:hypothetical protein
MRREHLYLHDIRETCDMIQAFLEGLDASAFLASELHKAATLQKLTVIGEAAARLPQAFRETPPQECRRASHFSGGQCHATTQMGCWRRGYAPDLQYTACKPCGSDDQFFVTLLLLLLESQRTGEGL